MTSLKWYVGGTINAIGFGNLSEDYVFGDFVTGLSSHVFEREYTGAKFKEVQKKMREASLKLEKELQRSYK